MVDNLARLYIHKVSKMKESNVIILTILALIVGFIGGVLYSSFSEQPPGLEAASSQMPPNAGRQAKAPGSDTSAFKEKLAEITAKIQANPDDPELYIQAGNLLYDHEQFAEALKFYQKALTYHPKNPDLLTDAGICYRRLGEPQKAVEFFKRAQKAAPDHKLAAFNLGVVLLHDLNDKGGRPGCLAPNIWPWIRKDSGPK